MHRTREQIEAAFKYVTLNLIASSLFLTALGLLYGSTGTLNMADLAGIFRARETTSFEMVICHVVPDSVRREGRPVSGFFWLPASYHTPPAAVGAIFAGLLTKVGVYSLIRVFSLLFRGAPEGLFTLLLIQALCTMVVDSLVLSRSGISGVSCRSILWGTSVIPPSGWR